MSQTQQAPIAEFGIKSDFSGWLRVLVTVERQRSRWAVVKSAYRTRPEQFSERFIPAGSLHSRCVVCRKPSKREAVEAAERTTP